MITGFSEAALVSGRQKGAVLVVSLIVLLVLTLMGIGGMNSSVMQERMASNAQNSNREFQAAESAIDSVMQDLMAGTYTALQAAMNSASSISAPTTVTITGLTADVRTQYLGEIYMTNGDSMNANEDTPFLKGHRYQVIGQAEMTGSGTPHRVYQGVERR